MIASLAMYDRLQTRAASERFWAEIRENLRNADIDAPQELEWKAPFWEVWQSPDLIFSQTCGRPYRLHLHDKTTVIGTPDYGLRDCDPGYYRSAFVVRTRDHRTDLKEFETARFAYNEQMSQSGWAAAQCTVGKLGFHFENIWQSGGHVKSAQAVAEGLADIAAIDGLTWDLIKRYEPFSLDLRVAAWSEQTPGLPYITGPSQPRAALFDAVQNAISALSLADRMALRIKGLVDIPASDYLAIPDP